MTSALALLPAGVALADDGGSQAPQAGAIDGGHHGRHGHRQGLVGKALRLDSLTPAQRSTIEGLVRTQRSAWTPVRQADAAVLTQLAQGVERRRGRSRRALAAAPRQGGRGGRGPHRVARGANPTASHADARSMDGNHLEP